MTNDEIRAVVITGKYAVRASPKGKRNIEQTPTAEMLADGFMKPLSCRPLQTHNKDMGLIQGTV